MSIIARGLSAGIFAISALNEAVASDPREQELKQCIEQKLADLRAQKDKTFLSGMLGVMCTNPETLPPCKSEQHWVRKWEIPAGDRARYNIEAPSVQFTVFGINGGEITDGPGAAGDLKSAWVNLHCNQTKCYGGRKWIEGRLKGQLRYQTDLDDVRHAAGECVNN